MEVLNGIATPDSVYCDEYNFSIGYKDKEAYPFGYFPCNNGRSLFLVGERGSAHEDIIDRYNREQMKTDDFIYLDPDSTGRLFIEHKIITFWDKYITISEIKDFVIALSKKFPDIMDYWHYSAGKDYQIIAHTIKEYFGTEESNFDTNFCKKYNTDNLYSARQMNRLWKYGYVDENKKGKNMKRTINEGELREIIKSVIRESLNEISPELAGLVALKRLNQGDKENAWRDWNTAISKYNAEHPNDSNDYYVTMDPNWSDDFAMRHPKKLQANILNASPNGQSVNSHDFSLDKDGTVKHTQKLAQQSGTFSPEAVRKANDASEYIKDKVGKYNIQKKGWRN